MMTRVLLALPLFTLIACSGTDRYVEQMPVEIHGHEGVSLGEALNIMFVKDSEHFNVVLCEADINSKTCNLANKGIEAKGLGGIFLPLTMELTEIDVKESRHIESAIDLSSELRASINGITPWCGELSGTITTNSSHASLIYSNFYCNWAGIGNVVTNLSLSIDHIDVSNKTFSGFYKMSFYGTGNASGSGYYVAKVVQK